MLILRNKKAVVLKLRDPERVLEFIPTARRASMNGTSVVAVPHKPEETKVLRNLGFDVPAPMRFYYDFPARFKPFEAQKVSAEFATMNNRCFILNSMGLGKTITTLWAFDYLRKCKQVGSMLVVCPLSTLERTWADEAFRAFPEYKVNVLYGTKEKRLALLQDKADIYLINTDGAKIIKDAMAERSDIDLIVIDELALVRNYRTDRWKVLNEICNKQTPRRVWGLTGSPIPNSPADAFGEIKLVTPESRAIPRYYGAFRNQVMLPVGPYKWVAKPGAADTVYKAMQPAVRYSIDECVDLPEQIFITKQAEFTEEQRKAYRTMLAYLQAEYEDGKIVAVNEAVKASKLLQIALGVAYGDGEEEVVLPSQPRLDVLLETIEESEGKVLVFVPFTAALNHVSKCLTENGISNAVVDGSTSKSERDETFRRFQMDSDPRVIVANPSAMSHGLTLTAATTVVWYGPVHSNEIYQQACARVRRPGQTRTTVIVHVVSTKYEEKIYERLKNKQSLQGALLELMQDQHR